MEPERHSVQRLFSLPFVRFVGAHTGCSCGFPSIRADESVEYFDGIWDADDRQADLKSVKALLAMVQRHVTASGSAELFAVWQGEETMPPKGSVSVPTNSLEPERFFFIERFLYRIVTPSPQTD